MTGTYLTSLAEVCRRAGLTVHEQAGWQTRGRSSGGYAAGRPWCIMWHHTASDTTPANDVNYIITAQDAPLSNLYLARDGSVYVIAAGCTNTNGKGNALGFSKGTVPVDSMNTYAIGVEAASDGVGGPWPQVQIDAYFTLNNALCEAYGLEPSDCATHAEYAPSRKIDPATAAAVQGPWRPRSINSSGTWEAADVRGECVARTQAPTPPKPPTPEGNTLMFTILYVIDHPEALGGNMDGNGIIAQVTWLSPQRHDACIAQGAAVVTISVGDVINCDLLGPLPDSFKATDFANVVG